MDIPIYTITGPSGAGKSSIVAGVKEWLPHSYVAKSHTTREPRPGEEDEYYYVSRKEFLNMVAAGSFVEYVEAHGNFYGITKTEFEPPENFKRVLFIATPEGVEQVFEHFVQRNAVHSIFIMIERYEALEGRLVNRGNMSLEKIQSRMEQCKTWLDEMDWDLILCNYYGNARRTIVKMVQYIKEQELEINFNRI